VKLAVFRLIVCVCMMLVYGYITLLPYSTNYDLVIISALNFFLDTRVVIVLLLCYLNLVCRVLTICLVIVLTVLRVDGPQVRMF